jgi:hypothetical protein
LLEQIAHDFYRVTVTVFVGVFTFVMLLWFGEIVGWL